MQNRLQTQLKLLKVEEAALLKMISTTAREDVADNVGTHSSIIGKGNGELLDDASVNQAPLDLKGLTVAKTQTDSLPVLDINPSMISSGFGSSEEIKVKLKLSESEEEEHIDDE